jgi:hypothetical protein
MKRRVSTDSWIAFIAGFYVSSAIYGVGFWIESLMALVFPTVFQVFREDIIDSIEGLLVVAASMFIGVRLLVVGRRYLTAAIWYMMVCLSLTIAHDALLLRRIAPSDYTIASLALGVIFGVAALAFLLYIRFRATREA